MYMNKIFSRALMILSVIFLIATGCKEQSQQDNSLSLQEYRKIGMPDPEKSWGSHDFSLAFSVLEDVKTSQPHKLPMMDSKKSGRIFSRILDMDNLQFIDNSEMPIAEKLRRMENFLRVCENTIRLYTNENQGLQYYHRELTEAYLYGLSLSGLMIDLSTQENTTAVYDSADPIQSYYLSGLFSLLRAQNNVSSFTESEHKLLVSRVGQSVRINLIWFDEIVREDLKKAFLKISDSTRLIQYEAGYDGLIREL